MADIKKRQYCKKMGVIFNVEIEKDYLLCTFIKTGSCFLLAFCNLLKKKKRLDLKRQCDVREKDLDYELPM